MKYSALISILVLVLASMCLAPAAASFCPCDLKTVKTEVCGSNGVTYKNRCEFECTQRDYKKLGRNLNIRKEGPC
ncbi:uncharacterized protein LOC108162508 [Drosophila miranda]|uniref:uncharacterized protein LOC108162508 n=1 Tax=Drosophila miranda TaxID=7229 RepID=UPI0007E83D5C|nr:uncharacterized protein LOC108162508 [Drosophila miranda]